MIGKTNSSYSAGGIVPSGTINIDENGIYDVTHYESASVSITPINYRIVVAELPNTAIKLYNSSEILLETSSTGNSGGVVSFGLSSSGTYIIRAYDVSETLLWENSVVIEDIGIYNVRTSKALTEYSIEELHSICQGGYFEYMFEVGQKWVFSQSGSILNNYYVFIEKIDTVAGKNKVNFRFSKAYTAASYFVNQQISYLQSSSSSAFSKVSSSAGGYKYSGIRRLMQESGKEIWSQATSIKPNGSTVVGGIEFSNLKYTDSENVSGIYTYNPSTDTFTQDISFTYFSSTEIAQSLCKFVNGYFKLIGILDETTFNSGNYYTLDSETMVYSTATSYVEGTTYYGFYRYLQEDGLFLEALSSIKSYLTKFSDLSSTGLINTSYTSETADYVDIPCVEEITGVYLGKVLSSGNSYSTVNAYNIANEGELYPAYNTFEMTAAGNSYWTRSTYSNNSYNYFCRIGESGSIMQNDVNSYYYLKVGFIIN